MKSPLIYRIYCCVARIITKGFIPLIGFFIHNKNLSLFPFIKSISGWITLKLHMECVKTTQLRKIAPRNLFVCPFIDNERKLWNGIFSFFGSEYMMHWKMENDKFHFDWSVIHPGVLLLIIGQWTSIERQLIALNVFALNDVYWEDIFIYVKFVIWRWYSVMCHNVTLLFCMM